MPQVAQVGPRLFLGRVRPEEESELLARNRAAAVEEKVSQQLLEPGLVKAGHRPAGQKQGEMSREG